MSEDYQLKEDESGQWGQAKQAREAEFRRPVNAPRIGVDNEQQHEPGRRVRAAERGDLLLRRFHKPALKIVVIGSVPLHEVKVQCAARVRARAVQHHMPHALQTYGASGETPHKQKRAVRTGDAGLPHDWSTEGPIQVAVDNCAHLPLQFESAVDGNFTFGHHVPEL